jgi:LysR family glycine cleavage system transcriptional activator
MARRLPPLTAVRAFEAAARLGSFTRAAEELGMTQSGISYQVRQLEDLVQGPLFTKRGRGVELTSLGEKLAPPLTQALDGIAKAFSDLKSNDAQVLTVACSQVFGANWLAPRIGRFQLGHPGLAVRVMASDALADLERGDADIAIRSATAPWPGLSSTVLMRTLVMPMVHPDFLARHNDPATPDAVLRLPRASPEDIWWSMWHEQVTGKGYDETARPSLRFDSQLMDGSAAIAGHSAAMLNPFMWQPQIEQGLLVPALDRWAIAKTSAWFCCLPRRRDERKIRAFRNWIGLEIGETLTWLGRHFGKDITSLMQDMHS